MKMSHKSFFKGHMFTFQSQPSVSTQVTPSQLFVLSPALRERNIFLLNSMYTLPILALLGIWARTLNCSYIIKFQTFIYLEKYIFLILFVRCASLTSWWETQSCGWNIPAINSPCDYQMPWLHNLITLKSCKLPHMLLHYEHCLLIKLD